MWRRSVPKLPIPVLAESIVVASGLHSGSATEVATLGVGPRCVVLGLSLSADLRLATSLVSPTAGDGIHAWMSFRSACVSGIGPIIDPYSLSA
ncbi:hypothetical protein BCR34DRAFT_577483 [Clohesyomyces aquaticus]|uniref:Uncharacterized protein n=1 Tax=Clohesyomyces aquaticus TaxID=1231657 RepID=A0A1Y1YJA8_9PLEO|nr:hypothetical protein BCR34DRAFT_577483 [Clohesyomyces aquaticus]